MASMSVSEEDLSCPVCCDIYKDPVLLTCTHSICNGCLKTFWESKGSRECPVCRTRSSNTAPPLNLFLRNMCESFLTGRGQKESFCSLHRAELKLFCEDDQQLVCLVCRDSKLHKTHNFSPISEVALERKEELKVKLKPLKMKLNKINEAKDICVDSAQHISVQAQDTERQIKEKFEKLHQILRDEEAAKIAALREEVEQKSQMMKEKIEKMAREISSLSDTIRAIEKDMRTDDITFLRNYNSTTMRRAQCTTQDPERVSETLNLAKYLGNLRVWEKMRKIFQYTPVTLDPNTAHPKLTVSEDQISVTYSRKKQQLPDNPERFDHWINVLGSEGFNSGTHCWDVEVGSISCWDLGVVTESAKRKGQITNWSGVWFVLYKNDEYKVFSSLQPAYLLEVKQKPQRIRVKLDWDRGKVSLYDLDNHTHLHTFTHIFTERVFPYFGTQCEYVPLRILPLNHSFVSLNHRLGKHRQVEL